jgi:hypothetical protein
VYLLFLIIIFVLLLMLQELEVTERELSERMEALHDECEELKQREKSLVADIKRRGDAARQLVMSKDAEIQKLKLKLGTGASKDASTPTSACPAAKETSPKGGATATSTSTAADTAAPHIPDAAHTPATPTRDSREGARVPAAEGAPDSLAAPSPVRAMS